MVDRYNKKKTPRSEKWNLLTTTKSVQLSRWFGKIGNATGSSMRDDSRSTMVCELRFTREVASRAGPGDEPMDVDILVKGKSKGKNKGKGKGNGKQPMSKGRGPSIPKSYGTFRNCGKYGHKASDCWAMSVHPGTPKAEANARTRKARTARTRKANTIKQDLHENEAETASLELGAFHASQSRLVQFLEPVEQSICGINMYKESGYVKFSLDTGAAVTVCPLDTANNRPEQHRHSKGYITVSGERIPDFE